MITAAELTTPDYEYISDFFQRFSPELGQDDGRNVFTYFRDGYFSGWKHLELLLLLRINDIDRKAIIYCRSYETQGETVSVEFDYEKAVEMEKVFSQDVPEAIDYRFIDTDKRSRIVCLG